jgi:hypothetical protein
MAFKKPSRCGNVADRMSRQAKRHQEKRLLSMGGECRSIDICDIAYCRIATSAIAHCLVATQQKPRRGVCPGAVRKCCRWIGGMVPLTDEEAEARTGHSGCLAGHRLAEALALESSGQV